MRKHQTDQPGVPANRDACHASAIPYDTLALRDLAEHWRAEAERAPSEAMRTYCLNEADKCEQRLQKSLSTPVIRDWQASRS